MIISAVAGASKMSCATRRRREPIELCKTAARASHTTWQPRPAVCEAARPDMTGDVRIFEARPGAHARRAAKERRCAARAASARAEPAGPSLSGGRRRGLRGLGPDALLLADTRPVRVLPRRRRLGPPCLAGLPSRRPLRAAPAVRCGFIGVDRAEPRCDSRCEEISACVRLSQMCFITTCQATSGGMAIARARAAAARSE